MDINKINFETEKIFEDLIKTRRKIHEFPELGLKEYKTTDLIIGKLKEYGIEDVRKIKDTGVVALISGKSEKCIGIRADIDALALEENTDLPFKSKNKGKMHACGHDIHTTCLLGTAYVLNKIKDELPGSVKLIFQPGEETGKGANYMIKEGVLENPKLLGIFGLHSWPHVEAGKVFHRSGKMSASSDVFYITIKGKQGHAAHPESAVDPIYISGNIIVSMQSIISRELSPFQSAIITFAQMEGGNLSNVIPKEVKLKGAIRTLSEETRDYVHKRFTELTMDLAKSFRGEAEVKIKKGISSGNNDEIISKYIKEATEEILGKDNYIYNPEPSMGAEDFSCYTKYVPGAMYRLGTGFKDVENPSLHSDSFCANEESIKTGVKVNTLTAIKLLENL